jgi:rhodanese-related sulfurtransferase
VQAAVAAKKVGYTNVSVYFGGFPDWARKGYEAEKP